MRILLFLFLNLVNYSNALTFRTRGGRESIVVRIITIDLEARLTCMYETLEKEMMLELQADVTPSSNAPISMRLTSPTGAFSEWLEGRGEVNFRHITTEDGDYEICISSSRNIRVLLTIYFKHPEKVGDTFEAELNASLINRNLEELSRSMGDLIYKIYNALRFYNLVTVSDEATQRSNSYYIKVYVISFCIANIIVAILQVAIVRRMFRVDKSRIRI
ncbi:hypothetical protein RB195_007752 [Necator americanus]|uniref:GOLD domain-containing protein n=2 Tax=Necator americanus TaxID=51031 RepID=A0ABR1C0B2_NECAM